MSAETTTNVGFLLIPGFALMSYASAIEPLRAANQLSGRELYRWWNTTPGGKPVAASSGTTILPDFAFETDSRNLDLLLICAGGNPATFNDRATFSWLRRLARFSVALGGISGGPFILARAGLLENYRCTIHWEHMPAFTETFPEIDVTTSLFELDGQRLTCSGGIGALDMMLALIERDHGHLLASAVGEWFLHTHVREGIGPQRMDLRARWGVTDQSLVTALKMMENNIETPLDRAILAAEAGVSLRQLERAFRNQLGRGVHEHYLALRLNRARQLLRETSLSIMDVAMATGFGSASHFSRAFRVAHGLTPSAARAHRSG